MMQGGLREKYPVHRTLDVLDGFDIYRSTKLIIAIVVIDSEFGKKIKLYRSRIGKVEITLDGLEPVLNLYPNGDSFKSIS